MSALSDKTKNLVSRLYKSREAMEVCDILDRECGTEALSCEGWSPEQMERIRFAVLKLVKENAFEMEAAIKLAQLDWRDLLMSAGFGEDLIAHELWAKNASY